MWIGRTTDTRLCRFEHVGGLVWNTFGVLSRRNRDLIESLCVNMDNMDILLLEVTVIVSPRAVSVALALAHSFHPSALISPAEMVPSLEPGLLSARVPQPEPELGSE